MARSGVFYVAKAMERAAAGTGPADDHDAPEISRAPGGGPSLVRRVLAAVRRGTGSAPGHTGHRRPGRALRAD